MSPKKIGSPKLTVLKTPRPGKAKEKAKGKKKGKEKFEYKDFSAITILPERLAHFLRLWLHVSKAEWDFVLDKIRQGRTYKLWSKSKGRGKGRRHFASPCDELKFVQRAILNRMLFGIPVHFARHGNQKGSSIITNAAQHAGTQHVFSVDIINAFPTVFRSRIRANLKKPFVFGLRQFAGITFTDDEVAQMLETIVDLVCFHDRLPQGPPTSPRILDIVCLKMDTSLWGLITRHSTPFQEYRFTAWADDLTISSTDEIPEELRKAILTTIKDHGFIPHTREDKTRYYSPDSGTVPVVTGLVINLDGRLTMAPGKVNQFRARLNGFLRHKTWDAKMRGQIAGTLGYIRQVYPTTLPSKIRAHVEQVEARWQGSAPPTTMVPPTVPVRKRSASKPKPVARKGKGGPKEVLEIV